MLSRNIAQRNFSLCVINCASKAPPAKGRGQSFSGPRSRGAGQKKESRKNVRASMFRNWKDTVQTAQLQRTAVNLSSLEITPSNIDSIKEITSSLNKVVQFSDKQYKILRHLGSFKKDQFNELFQNPVSLIRKDTTLKMIDLLTKSTDKNFIITGESGVGKSVLLSHVQAYASSNDYIIINVSYPRLFLDGLNDFFYDPDLKSYVQPMFLKNLITKIVKSNNSKLLTSIKLKNDYKFLGIISQLSSTTKTFHFKKDESNLLDLLSLKIQPRHRGQLFNAIISELMQQSEIPILFTIDNFSYMLTNSYSKYKNTSGKLIPLLDLQVGKLLMDIVRGKIKSSNPNSATVLAISSVDRTNQTLPVGLEKMKEDIYTKRYHYDSEFANILKEGKIQEFHVPKLTKEEVKELINFYSKAGIIHDRDTKKDDEDISELVDRKYILSGNGNPRELLKSLVLTHL